MDTNRLDALKCDAQKTEESLSGKSAEWWEGYRQGRADHKAQVYHLIYRNPGPLKATPARFDTSIPRRDYNGGKHK